MLPLLGGVALAMLVDATMLYRMFGSRAFPADGAWPPGVAAAEAIRAGDEGGRRVGILGAGVLAGIVGTGFLGIPMSAFGVAFIGNVWALSMFGIGLLVRGYSPQLFSAWLPRGDIGAAFIPHGIMIGAGLVALVQVGAVLLAKRSVEAAEPAGPGRALGAGSLAYVVIAVLIALGGGLTSELSPSMLVLFVVYAAFAALVHELIVGLAAMHSGWFPAFAVALITLIIGMLIGFPPVSLALLVGFSAATGPAFADMGYDLKAGFILRGHGADPAFERDGRFQQYLARHVRLRGGRGRRAALLQGLFRRQPGGARGQGLRGDHPGRRRAGRGLAAPALGDPWGAPAAHRRAQAADGRAVRHRHADRLRRCRLGRAGGRRPARDLRPPPWPRGARRDGSIRWRRDRGGCADRVLQGRRGKLDALNKVDGRRPPVKEIFTNAAYPFAVAGQLPPTVKAEVSRTLLKRAVRALISVAPEIVAVSCLVTIIWWGIASILSAQRCNALDGAARDTTNLSRAFEENTQRVIASSDQILLSLRAAYTRDGPNFDLRSGSSARPRRTG